MAVVAVLLLKAAGFDAGNGHQPFQLSPDQINLLGVGVDVGDDGQLAHGFDSLTGNGRTIDPCAKRINRQNKETQSGFTE